MIFSVRGWMKNITGAIRSIDVWRSVCFDCLTTAKQLQVHSSRFWCEVSTVVWELEREEKGGENK